MPWSERCAMECEKCKTERRRRCIIIDQQEDTQRHRKGAFTDAPFVHPFRSPTNHAQRLRALLFAQEHQARILLVIAHDAPVDKEGGAKRKVQDNWLTRDDRSTAGIPGLFPFVLNLPVRFTQEPDRGDRLKGVFTNAHGRLVG